MEVTSKGFSTVSEAYEILVPEIDVLIHKYGFKYINDGKVDGWYEWRNKLINKSDREKCVIIHNRDSANYYWNIFGNDFVKTYIIAFNKFSGREELLELATEVKKAYGKEIPERYVKEESKSNRWGC